MARPLKPTFTAAQQEELRRLTSDAPLVMQNATRTQPMLTSEPGQLRQLIKAEAIVLTYCQAEAPPGYHTQPTTAAPSLVHVEPDPQLKRLQHAWKLIDGVANATNHTATGEANKRLAPRLAAFHHTHQPLMEGYGNTFSDSEGVLAEPLCHDIDRLLKENFDNFQAAIRSPETQRHIKHHQIKHGRNRTSLLNYLDALFDAYPSLYVLHLNLGYDVLSRPAQLQATYSTLRKDLQTLFYARHTNPMWKDDLVGHIWKIDEAPERRFHAHLLLFYNGANAHQHKGDADILKHRWIEEITHQKGALYNRTDGQAPVLVPENIGYLVESDDKRAINDLKTYLTYLTRISQLFGLETTRQANVFSRGHLPRQPSSPDKARR